ncbi:MAG: hypothetical protein J6O00_02870 [Clostridiales bacterium]|nr:hypothetical protein [Clostridiales bacterium]
MAKNDKRADSGIKASRRSKAIVITLVTVFAVIVIGWFVYISGLLPKVMTGVKIQRTVDGVTQTIDNISVAETNYHYYQVLSSYYNYGIINNNIDLDSVYDTTNGTTYRQLLLDQAGSELMNSVLVNEEAEARGYLPHSGASRYADLSVESVESTAALYGFQSVDAYLEALYGRGMSVRILRNCLERQALTQEYENYVRQFIFTVSEEELNAAYDANPLVYQRVDFDYYFFAGELQEDGTYDLTEATENANTVIDNATDEASFASEVVAIIGDETAELAGFTEDYNPTHVTSYTSASCDSIVEGLSDYLFADERVEGDTTVIESEFGVYAVMFEARSINDAPAATYRTLTMYNEAAMEQGATPESIAAGLAEVQQRANEIAATPMDSLAFADTVKANSDSVSEIITAGYNDGTTVTRFQATDENPISDRDVQLGNWLFDSSRVTGDMLVLPSEDSSYVTVYYFENVVPEWMYTARTQIITSMVNSWSNDILSDSPTYLIAYDLIRRLSN